MSTSILRPTLTKLPIAEALNSMLKEPLPLRFTAYDGSATGPEDSPYGIHLATERGRQRAGEGPGATTPSPNPTAKRPPEGREKKKAPPATISAAAANHSQPRNSLTRLNRPSRQLSAPSSISPMVRGKM